MKSLQLKLLPHLPPPPSSFPSSSSPSSPSILGLPPSLPLSSSFIAPLSIHLCLTASRPKPRRSLVLAQSPNAHRPRPDSDANVVLRLAWYAAEALGNVVAALNPKGADDPPAEAYPAEVGAGPLARENVVQAIKKDYDKAYFVTGGG